MMNVSKYDTLDGIMSKIEGSNPDRYTQVVRTIQHKDGKALRRKGRQ